MAAPIEFIQANRYSGALMVKVGKSETLREVEMTDKQRMILLADLAQWAGFRFRKETSES